METLDSLRSDPRVAVRREGDPDPDGGCVVYWMQRAQRGEDNPALDAAIQVANLIGRPVAVFFGLHPGYPNANQRHYSFLIDGLEQTREAVEKRGAAFVFRPYPDHDLISFCSEVRASLVVGDENPLREAEGWRRSAAARLKVPFWTVDADVIVPSRFFEKEEYAARTIRPKINRLLPAFLVPPANPKARHRWPEGKKPSSGTIDKAGLIRSLPLDRSASPVEGVTGGAREAKRALKRFIDQRLANYDTDRNKPEIPGTSELSHFLHFGQISPLRVALEVSSAEAPAGAAFLEELIVRRELAINYVARNPHYDSLKGCHEWARKTLAEHAADEREYLYDAERFESATTHDPLWNAAQSEMVKTGRMHGFMRMYWAKKILEWTSSPEEAFDIAVSLNDRYELDGRDPNGYTGVAWAIGGKHDRPWGPARPVFGLIRYMNARGCARKFDVDAYISRVGEMS
ncbi:MAG: deoxyribodipyrimidine photo-lyase [Blastocatellales bacterium]